MTLTDLIPIATATQDANLKSVVNQVNNIIKNINNNNSGITTATANLQDISMQSDKVLLDETSSGLEFVCEDDGTLLEDA